MSHAGRKPQGAKLVESLAGSEHARRRLALFLETMAGHCTVGEACAELGIGESRFFAQRSDWLQGSLALLEPRCAGRPPKPAETASPEELQALRQRVRELEVRTAAAAVQSELIGALPHVVRRPRPGKKTPRRGRHAPPGAMAPR